MSVSDLIIRSASVRDLPGVLAVQYEAFGRVARQLGIDPAVLPPLTERLADLERLHAQGTQFFAAVDRDGTIVGSVRGVQREGVVEVGRLVVSRDRVRQGVGTALMELLESSFPDAPGFVLFTGADAADSLAFYRHAGYAECAHDDTGPVRLVWLEKRRDSR